MLDFQLSITTTKAVRGKGFQPYKRALQKFHTPNVRSGSKTGICFSSRHVCFRQLQTLAHIS
jgi:hypothetical protein